MRIAFSILMTAAILLPGLTRIGIFIDFKINQDFIAEELCINKDEPLSLCSGKCYLTQQLKKADEQEEKQIPLSQKERLEITYFHQTNIPFSELEDLGVTGSLTFPYQSPFHGANFALGIFRPPPSA